MNYTDYVTTLATNAAYDPTDADFLISLANASTYANNRIHRELDMLVDNVRDGSASTTASNRNFNLPTTYGTFQVVSAINIITPASTAPDSGARNACQPVSLDVLDMLYPSASGATVPTMFAYVSQSAESGQSNLVFGPWPDATYRVEVVGKIIPAPLSATATTTFLGTYLPELYIAASMVYFAGFQKNYGAQADDVKQAQSWESQFQLLKASADVWEARKRFSGASWTSKQLEPTAAPQRG
jgi:hypothetical protein